MDQTLKDSEKPTTLVMYNKVYTLHVSMYKANTLTVSLTTALVDNLCKVFSNKKISCMTSAAQPICSK